jgi:outer membrane receptor protein involved in Fe transport
MQRLKNVLVLGLPALRRSTLLLAMLAAAFAPLTTRAHADQTARAVSGEVRDAADGAPVAGAVITLEETDGSRISATSDQSGAFVLAAPPAGRYRLVVAARGYRTASVTLAFAADRPRAVGIVLTRDDGLHEIGGAVSRSSGRANPSSGQSVSQQSLASTGALRVADALHELGGVGVSGDSLAPGGDAYVSLRGLRPGESQTLLDGHPIGPVGVLSSGPDTDGTIAGFNFQDAPYFALRDVDVTFGSGGNGLIGSDSIGGTVDLRTLEPTEHPEVTVQQGLGTQGRALTALRATGTSDKLGYALVHGVEGTYGLFSGGAIAQTGLRGTDFTSQTLAQLTYPVSGDYVLRNELAKLVYAPMPSTKITFSAYDATSWADKTGEGDNDFNPYDYTLANAPVGAAASCPHGVLVTTDTGPSCITPGAYAAAASGPAGGGPGAWQALRNQDYDLRIASTAGKSALALDAFTDEYAELYHRDASPVNGPLDAFLDRWSTQGVRFSDELTGPANAFGFGLSWLRQTLSGDETTPDGTALWDDAPAVRIDQSAFVRDIFSPTTKLSLIAYAWLKRSSIDPLTHFDPQLSLVYRPTASDALRLSAGRSTDEPGLQADRVDLLPVGALNPDCGAIARATASAPATVDVGSGPPANLSPETGSALELGYDHHFGSESTLGLTIYDTNVTNRIVTGEFAAGSLLASSAVPPLLARIGEFCGLSPAPGAVTFTLNRSFNAASARLRGIELTGRARMSPHFTVNYEYDVQSIVLNDLPASVLMTDPTLVNGIQAFEVPLQKATLGLEFETRSGLDFRLDGHAVGPNNPQQLPGYAYADASLTQTVSKQLVLSLAVSNVFDSHAQSYGLVGYGLPYATNQYNASLSTPFLQPFNERYGLEPTSLTVSATLHL